MALCYAATETNTPTVDYWMSEKSTYSLCQAIKLWRFIAAGVTLTKCSGINKDAHGKAVNAPSIVQGLSPLEILSWRGPPGDGPQHCCT